LLKIEKRSETEAPEDRQSFHGEEVRVYNLTYLPEHFEGSHLL